MGRVSLGCNGCKSRVSVHLPEELHTGVVPGDLVQQLTRLAVPYSVQIDPDPVEKRSLYASSESRECRPDECKLADAERAEEVEDLLSSLLNLGEA